MRPILAPLALGLALAVPAAVAAPRVSSFALENGLRGVVIEDHRAPVVTHMVWYPVGAADEQPGVSGIAHFLEHLMFKETDDLADGAFSKIVAANGGTDNAFTSHDYTGYFQRIATDRLDLVMGMEADRMRDLVISEANVETERRVILEERSQRTDNRPQALFGEELDAALYMNHPYGIPVIGWRHEIERLSRADALAFYERFYAPDNAILVVAGAVDPAEVEALARKHYGPLAPSARPPEARPQEPPQRAARRLRMEDARVRQPYVVRKYLVPSRASGEPREAAALSLLAGLLGSGITSRFAERLQIGDRTAIDTGAWYGPASRDATDFTIYAVPAAGVDLATVEEGLDAAIAEMVAHGPDEAELTRLKRRIAAASIYERDDQSALARRYGVALAIGLDLDAIEGWDALVQSVTAEEVRAAAAAWLVPARSVTGWLERSTREQG